MISLWMPGSGDNAAGYSGFSLAIYYSVLSQNVLGYTPLHWNEELQFCLVVRGQVLFLSMKNGLY